MKILSTNTQLKKQLERCITDYDNVCIAVAWASANTDTFQLLMDNNKKIKKVVIGTHFYQTDPDVLELLYKKKAVRFITQPSGVFHPKVYLFENLNGGGEWEAIIGSANFTQAALSRNAEVSTLISYKDRGAKLVLKSLKQQMDTYFDDAKSLNDNEVKAYRRQVEQNKSKLKQLGEQYGGKRASKSTIEIEFLNKTWAQYKKGSGQDPHASLNDRLEVLGICRQAFKEFDSFANMPIEYRQMVAGTPSALDDRWGWFGSMRAVGDFMTLVNSNSKHIAKAVDSIPLEGDVTYQHYQTFIKHYLKAFGGQRDGIATASRLLALKRPDTFVCLNSKNEKKLKEAIGIRFGKKDYDAYWDELILRIQSAVWWNKSRPEKTKDLSIWLGRAALLDAYFYEE